MKRHKGFTRIELLAILAAIGLLGTLGLSVLANTAVRSDLAVCANNLRQVGRAFHMWASDHGNENPWWTSYTDGGSYINPSGPQPQGGVLNVPGFGPAPAGLRNNAWVQLAFIHQELQSPGLLVCPADTNRLRASEFSAHSANGFFSLNLRDRAASYFVGLHSVARVPNWLLSGDRSIRDTGTPASCAANIQNAATIPFGGPVASGGWTSDLHNGVGNLLAQDGHVEELSSAGLWIYIRSRFGDELGNDHVLKPQ